jgi:chromosome segregation and condensation protein ScpB
MDPQEFITTAEARQVDGALLATHEKFLARITISSLRLLAKIANDRGEQIESLTPEAIIAWFEADSKRQLAEGTDRTLNW